MPYDQVVTFPSKVNKVDFKTQQVTTEMQGVQVSGCIIWTVYREGEGPFLAYKNLGKDLASKIPNTANENLIAQASAIVRSVIANATLRSMLTDRQKIRHEVLKNMKDQVKGWGVWIESVEVTDVRIMSDSLFTDLQAEFREMKKKDAEIYTADINDKIAEERVAYELDMKQVDDQNAIELNQHHQDSNIRIETQLVKNEAVQSKLRGTQADNTHEFGIKKSEVTFESNIKIAESTNKANLNYVDYQIKGVQLEAQTNDAEFKLKKL